MSTMGQKFKNVSKRKPFYIKIDTLEIGSPARPPKRRCCDAADHQQGNQTSTRKSTKIGPQIDPNRPQIDPRSPQAPLRAPRRPPRAPKTTLGGPREAPRAAQEPSWTPLGAPRDPPRAPLRSQKAPWELPEVPRGDQNRAKIAPKSEKLPTSPRKLLKARCRGVFSLCFRPKTT